MNIAEVLHWGSELKHILLLSPSFDLIGFDFESSDYGPASCELFTIC